MTVDCDGGDVDWLWCGEIIDPKIPDFPWWMAVNWRKKLFADLFDWVALTLWFSCRWILDDVLSQGPILFASPMQQNGDLVVAREIIVGPNEL